MPFEKISEHLNGLLVIRSKEFFDDRGSFMELYRADDFRKLGIPLPFVQENYSRSKKGVIRGLHFQWDPPMGKLMRVMSGSAFLAAADIRRNSPSFGEWFGLVTPASERIQIWAPPGFARGFCALEDDTEVQYLCTGVYNPQCEAGIRWDDSELNIGWPATDPVISEKDIHALTLSEWTKRPESGYFSI